MAAFIATGHYTQTRVSTIIEILTTVFGGLGSDIVVSSCEGGLLRELGSIAADTCFVPTDRAVIETDREVEPRFLLVVVEFALEVLGTGWGPRTQGNSQELICSPGLHILLVEQIEQQVLIPLYQALTINLAMLQLLIPIPLNAFQQSGEGLLLLLPQQCLLLLNGFFHLVADLVVVLLLLHLLALDLEQFGLFVPLHESKLFYFVF